MKKTALLLAAILCASTLTACSGSSDASSQESQASNAASTSGETAETDEPMTLTFFVTWMEKVNETQPVRQKLEEELNIKMDMQPSLDKEALNLRIAGGDLPDYIRDQT